MTKQPPAIVETVSERSSELADTRAELADFVAAVDDYQERVDNLSGTERELFYESVADLHDQVAKASDPEDLLEMREELDEAVRSPLQQVARDSLVSLLGQLQPALSDSERTQTFDALESKIPAELETATEAYQNLTNRVPDFEPVLGEMLAAAIEAEPSILQQPQKDLVPLADRLATRHEALAELETIFAASAWAPTPDFTSNTAFYRDDPSNIELATVEPHLDEIGEGVSVLDSHGIELQTVLQENVSEAAATGELPDLMDTLEDLAQTIPAAADTLTTTSEFVTTLETADSTPDAFEADVRELQESHGALQTHDFATVEYLVQQLDNLKDDIAAFVNRLHGRLQAQSEFIEEVALADHAEAQPELQLQLHPSPTAVRANPNAALADYAALQTWLNSQLDTGSDAVDQTEMVELWQSIAEGEPVTLTGENQETVLALAERLSLQVSLND